MTDNRKHLIRSGAFLIVGTVIAIFTIILLGGDSKLFQKNSTLYVEFPQVQGLNMGAVVSLAGLPVGNVSQIEFDAQSGMIIVELKIKQSEFAKLSAGTQAEIRTQGALGDKYIYIAPGSNDGEKLKSGSHIPALKSADILAILSEKGGEAVKIFEIINQIHIMTKSINEGNKLSKIMNNLDEGTASIKKVATSAEGAMQKFDRVMTKIDKGEGTLGALISDPSIHDQIKGFLGGSQRKTHVKSMLRKSIGASPLSQ